MSVVFPRGLRNRLVAFGIPQKIFEFEKFGSYAGFLGEGTACAEHLPQEEHGQVFAEYIHRYEGTRQGAEELSTIKGQSPR